MTEAVTVTLRVTGVRSQNPRGFGGAIFTGVPIDATGSVPDTRAYVVIKATRTALGTTRVERGQWWHVSGPVTERRVVVDGFELLERQVEAAVVHLAMPAGEHIIKYIADNPAFEGLGSVKARRLWERFGERLYSILDAGDASTLVDVLTDDAAQTLVNAWAEHGQSQTLQWLQVHGFDLSVGRKVSRYFGLEAQARIEEDPYRLLSFLGKWTDVDRLAMTRFGVSADDPRRLRGAVEEACYRMFANGHTAMLKSDLEKLVVPLLGESRGVSWRSLLAEAMDEGLANGSVVESAFGLQPLGALVMERQVAKAICERLTSDAQQLLDRAAVDRVIAAVQAEDGISLNQEQQAAIHLAAEQAFACITGGAGVGKTTVLKSLYRIYDGSGVRVLQVALAGRAAKRMQEATGRAAVTIASFLKAMRDADFDGPTVLVIDEASMVDIVSMSRICAALPSHVRLLLAGDPHQLMPVGPGLVLHCLVQLAAIPAIELKTVKRYGGEIARVASAVRAGHWPTVATDHTAPVAFIPCDDRQIAELVVQLYAMDPERTQVLSPLRNGPAGTKVLNQLCQERFTNGCAAVTRWNDEFERPEHCGFNQGDVLLCTRNMWDKALQNGSLGKVMRVEAPPVEASALSPAVLAWVEWDDGILRAFTEDMLEDIELGRAVTVHKAQGSQWPRVIVPVTDSRLLDRTLLYTAITRAQVQVLLVGNMAAARKAVLGPPKAHTRKVALEQALMRYLEPIEVSAPETA
ncbi:ATP-dependent DNA helicase [Paraburkholderia acidisoli]|uniref:AAA family ATPase n=1 Tax=Paraburkholderia acidisoli TaxID=2571748 RepID=A0A7Z2GEZ8_9BURK|nr:AAA family ATPase [Paraburkholderia acidisoli]QGZ60525.1 AAA family ATPase [Paraburkholderia acidisoli]